MTAAPPVIRIRALSKSYQRGEQFIPVLEGVDLDVNEAEFIALMGPSGSGKSTLLNLIAGIDQPTGGTIEIGGVNIAQLREGELADWRAAHVGFIFQFYNLMPVLTAFQNVELPLQLTGLSRLAAAHPMGWDLPVGEAGSLLSGGQRQLVALARCLITRPQIILMDEPTSSMDAQSEVSFLRHLQQACGHCTLIVVTHRPAVLDLVQRIVVIDGGRVVADGPKAQVLAALAAPPAAVPGTPVPLRPANGPQVVPMVKSA